MVDVAKVRLFGMDMGTFRWDESYNVARFEYDRDFVRKGIEPSPIMMPVQQGRIYSFGNLNRDTFNGLPGMLADSLPDTYGRVLFDQICEAASGWPNLAKECGVPQNMIDTN